MCQTGASVVQKETLERLEKVNLSVFVVWTPRYKGDNRSKAVTSTKIVTDNRARHFWDGSGYIPVHYGKQLELPSDEQFAWDTYMIFNAKAEWKATAPQPDDWMHQLGVLGRKHPRWLEGRRFHDSVREMMGQK